MSPVRYRRTPIEIESPEQLGYSTIKNNLAESSFSDRCLADYGVEADLGRVLLPYGDHLGAERLRTLIAGNTLSPDDILVTAGAASALFIIATSLLGPNAHALVCAPNYATNLETPRAIGADLETFELRFEDGWHLDLERLESRLRPDTCLVSVTYPHNPTGSTITRAELDALVALVENHPTARLLVDETYRELAYGDPLPMATTLSTRVLAVSSMSKTYGLPGLRVGWLTCRDERLMETLLAAKEQIFICGAVLEEELAASVLERRSAVLPIIHAKTRSQLAVVNDWIEGHELFEWVEPAAGVVCFPRIRPEFDVDIDRFYRVLLQEHGTYVGPGHWFDQDARFFRVGFAWPSEAELRLGLEALDLAAASAVAGSLIDS
ncbi:MAG TPA: aminotransferase class I/II-fold pyridoxal phosphate-dependent enzyme [Gaiellaceae bacterium]|nr:aminotransferase class I/II-fold pyridoxal phosphate-dependent enzyme [Gaiellaceae bacterium]